MSRIPEKTVIENQLKDSYLSYAMSVISSRAIPDVRDGLKPVQRRILYSMYESGMYFNKPHRKSSKVVGDVMANYHPHGDSAIYEALVRMARDFSMGQTLVNGQGNFGSIDNDPPAAMRYTEARLEKLAQTMLADIGKKTVTFRETYDGTGKEPVVLPASFPNILVNGSDGIAVGMATNIPPYNLGEVVQCAIEMIDRPDITIAEVQEIVPGPDFPTRGIITDAKAAKIAVATGRGSMKVKGRAEINTKGNKARIIVTEIPFQVVKTRLTEKISELVKEKRLEGISAIRDESNKKGIRLVIEVKKDASPEVVLNHLYKYTPLQSSFAVNALVLHNGKPEVMNVKSMIAAFLKFKRTVIVNRLSYELNKLRVRAHIAIGLRVAVDSIDTIIQIIRNSQDKDTARKELLAKKWPVTQAITDLIDIVSDRRNHIENNSFAFTEEQVQGILEMKLSKLTGLERDKITQELNTLSVEINQRLEILKSDVKIKAVMHEELKFIKDNFAVPRRTEISQVNLEDINDIDLIAKEDVVLTITKNGYIKRVNLQTYTTQKRGGKGKISVKTNEDDNVAQMLVSNTHDQLLFFTEKGKVYKLNTYKIPSASTGAKGRAIVNLISIEPEDKIKVIISSSKQNQKELLIFATKTGKVRKSSISEFESINEKGKIAIKLDQEDSLIAVKEASESSHFLIATKAGKALRCELENIRTIKSRNSSGVNGINLALDDEVISLCILPRTSTNNQDRQDYLTIPSKTRKNLREAIKCGDESELRKLTKAALRSMPEESKLEEDKLMQIVKEEQILLSINSSGYGKKTSAYEYRVTNRGGKGITNMDIAKGSVVQTLIVEEGDSILISDKSGKLIRCNTNEIPVMSRVTKGVKVFNIEKGSYVKSVQKVAATQEDLGQ